MRLFWRSLLKDLDLIVVALVVVNWQFLTGTPLSWRGALIVAGLCVLFRLKGVVQDVLAEPSVAPPVEEEKRVFVDEPEVVLGLARLKGYEGVRRFSPYIGKWMTISGRIEGIAESLQKDAVHLSVLVDDGRRVNLRFSLEHSERLRGLQQGQRITAVGRIQHRNFTFTLEECELVRAERVRLAHAS
jgi:hypothetical protein